MNSLFVTFICLLALPVFGQESADEKVVGNRWFAPTLGHVHSSPLRTSSSLTTIQCGHPIKLIESSKVQVAAEWAYVQVADYKGFILKEFLLEKRPECFQGKYPKFFDGLNLDLTELYYWGRLHDHYISGQSKVE